MGLGLNICDIYSYGGNTSDESWSGNAWETSRIMPNLYETLAEQYDSADGKKFILITHSWGTQLGELALEYSGVQPDLFITLSDPLSSSSVDDYSNFFFIPTWSVAGAQLIVSNYTASMRMLTFAELGLPPYDTTNIKWINYWDIGDIMSGPLDPDNSKDTIEDRIVRGDTERTLPTSIEVHAITSLCCNKENYWKDYSVIEEGKELRDRVKADIADILGLIAYYPFNGNANDESGNGYEGTVYGATPVTDRLGTPNSAYSFDGLNDYISIAPDLLNNLSEGTVVAYIYVESIDYPSAPIISKGTTALPPIFRTHS